MDLNALLAELQQTTETFTVQDIVFTTMLSFVLSLVIGYTYQYTYRGTSYVQSYVHTLVIMSMVVAIIMMIIGSNIARAFSLVGALSIIRFRNAIKDTRDVGFIFFAMAIGMACGTRFYMVGVVATFLISFLIWAMFRFDFFARDVREQLLRIRVPGDVPYELLFRDIFERFLERADLIAVETVQAGTLTEVTYSVQLKRGTDIQELMEEVRQLNGNNKVMLITGRPEVEV
jgi:uncharacterized membrane protein YhiD involved in acid resistance